MNKNPDLPRRPSLLRWIFSSFIVLAALAMIVFTVYFMNKNATRMAPLHVPSILGIRIEEVSSWDPEQLIEVMEGLPAQLSCEVVPPESPGAKTSFRFLIDGGEPREAQDCEVEAVIPGVAGSQHEITVEYWVTEEGQQPHKIGERRARVVLIPAREQLVVAALATPEKKRLQTLTVPPRAIPYARGTLRLEGNSSQYVALFFVDPEGSGSPVLQVTADAQAPAGYKVVTAPLRRYRRFGPELAAFAAWPDGPIQIGNLEDDRILLDLYVGIFKQADVEKVSERFLKPAGKSATGEMQLQVLSPGLEEIRSLAYRGTLSPPLRIVRAEHAPTETRSAWRALRPAAPPLPAEPATPPPAEPATPPPAEPATPPPAEPVPAGSTNP